MTGPELATVDADRPWRTPPPEDFDAPRPPGAGALLLFTAGFLLFTTIFQTLVYLVGALWPALRSPVAMLATGLVSTIGWGLAAWFWVSVRALPTDWLRLAPPRMPIRAWVFLALLVPVTLVFGSNLDALVLHAFPSLASPDPQMEFLTEAALGSPLAWALVIGLGVVAAPVCEELFFRGLALRCLRLRAWGALPAMAFTAALFAAVHLKIVGFFLLFMIGFVLAAITEWSGRLFPAVLFHALYNGLVLTIALGARRLVTPEMKPFTLTPPTPERPESVPLGTVFWLLALAGPALAWLLFLLRRSLRPPTEDPS